MISEIKLKDLNAARFFEEKVKKYFNKTTLNNRGCLIKA